MKNYYYILLVLLASNHAAFASEKEANKKKGAPALSAPGHAEAMAYERDWNAKHPPEEYVGYLKQNLKTPIRVPANSENIVVPMQLSQLKKDLYSFASADSLHNYIETTVKPNYSKYTPDAKLVANQLIEFSALRGLLYKMALLVDHQKMAHSFLLTFVMRFATSISIYFPYQQWNTAFNYIAEPYPGISQFDTVRDLQTYLMGTLYPAINDSDLRLRQIAIPEKGLVWDNTILMNDAAFPDAYDRYVYFQEAERYAWLAAKQRAMARMKIFCAYNFQDLFKVANQLAKMQTEEVAESAFSGWFGQTNGEVNSKGVSSKDRNDVVNDKLRYPNYGMKWPEGEDYAKQALHHYQQMVSDVNSAWSFLDNKKTEPNHVLLERGYSDIFDKRASKVLPTWKALLGLTPQGQIPSASLTSSPVTLTSHLEGTPEKPEKVTVDFVAFLNSPPEDLRSLMPSGYDANDDQSILKTKGSFKYHNYTRGMANQWNYKAYSALFPDLKNESQSAGDKIKGFEKILSESWGGRFIGLPLSTFLY